MELVSEVGLVVEVGLGSGVTLVGLGGEVTLEPGVGLVPGVGLGSVGGCSIQRREQK